jgi:hypothetical protein
MHEADMESGTDMMDMGNAVTVAPGETKKLTWSFDGGGEVSTAATSPVTTTAAWSVPSRFRKRYRECNETPYPAGEAEVLIGVVFLAQSHPRLGPAQFAV